MTVDTALDTAIYPPSMTASEPGGRGRH